MIKNNDERVEPATTLSNERERRTTERCLTDSPRVLVAEDDWQLRGLIADVLAFEGYFVTDVADAPAMLRAIQESKQADAVFDLIVTDVRMPGFTGLDALEYLRELGCWTPTIVVTAFPEETVKRHAWELGAFLLPKPFALDELRVIANRAIANEGG
jgi:DNA-binding response OmpR family regulator